LYEIIKANIYDIYKLSFKINNLFLQNQIIISTQKSKKDLIKNNISVMQISVTMLHELRTKF
jgi:hypothetical protein